MKILLTGSSGFIGSNLVGCLIDHDPSTEVYCFQRNETANTSAKAKVITGDLTISDFEKLLPENIDLVIHLAQSEFYRLFPDKANDIYSVNVTATFNIAEWARKTGVKKFIFASTGSVYKSSNKPLNEEDEIYSSNFYSASKIAAENLLRPYSSFFDVYILRIFSPFGKGQKNMLIANMIKSVEEQRTIQMSGNEGLLLSPIYIDDCVALISRLAVLDLKGYHIFNLGGNDVASLKEIVLEIGNQLKINPSISFDVSKESATISADSSKIYKATNYIPETNWREGIKKSIS